MTKLILAASAAILIASPALAASAVPDDQTPSQVVSMRNVDFANPAQVKHFYAKLRGAAVAVCDSNSANSAITRFDARCVVEVMAQAVKVADKPMLTAMYDNANSGSAKSNRALAGNDQ